MGNVSLTLAVFFVFLLVTPTLAQQWQTFYLDPSDPHWVKKEDPYRLLRDEGDKWVSDRDFTERPPKIYFKILEFYYRGGYIKFWYDSKGAWNMLHLYASKDGKEYVELWKCNPYWTKDNIEVTVKVPPGYKYFYFLLEDGFGHRSKLVLWKKIQFKISEEIPPPDVIPSPWQTFYLDPSDPHWIKMVNPPLGGRLRDEGDKWSCRNTWFKVLPKIYFKILEFDNDGGYIRFWYAMKGYSDCLSLYASKDGKEYVRLWWVCAYDRPKTGVTVKVPPGYKYFYFQLYSAPVGGSKLMLWKKIQFKTLPPPIPKAKIKGVDIKGYITTTALGSSMVALIYLLTRMR